MFSSFLEQGQFMLNWQKSDSKLMSAKLLWPRENRSSDRRDSCLFVKKNGTLCGFCCNASCQAKTFAGVWLRKCWSSAGLSPRKPSADWDAALHQSWSEHRWRMYLTTLLWCQVFLFALTGIWKVYHWCHLINNDKTTAESLCRWKYDSEMRWEFSLDFTSISHKGKV